MPPVSADDAVIRRALSRRTALQALAAGVASLAAGCSKPDETVVAEETLEELPYVHLPEGLVPGLTQRYATALPLAGYGRGAWVTSFEGRPIKVEGNPRHPASLGATDVFAQAEILSLYDPDRSQTIRVGGEISDGPAFESALGTSPRTAQGRRRRDPRAAQRAHRLADPARSNCRAQDGFSKHALACFRAVGGRRASCGEAVYGGPLRLRPRLSDGDVDCGLRRRSARAGTGSGPFRPGARRTTQARSRILPALRGRTRDVADRRLRRPSVRGCPGAIEAMIAALAVAIGAPLPRPDLPPTMRVLSMSW